jgi:uncharacterized protein (TIGR00290 family)
MGRKKAWLSWSSGKDSAWCLDVVRRQGKFDVEALLTTVNAEYQRVAMHAVRETLLRAQAESAGLPVVTVPIPYPCPNSAYEAAMAAAIQRARSEGITHIVFGDLFLEDIRRYREEKLSGTGIEPVFPLWGLNTHRLAREMIDSGLRALVTCVDPKKLDRSFAGRIFDSNMLASFPSGVDPCGENGEFHTFAFAGPMFRTPIDVATGIIVERDGFVFADAQLRRNTPALPDNPSRAH